MQFIPYICYVKDVIIMVLTEKEQRVYKETKLRNLKRKYAKMRQHADLLEECIELKADIDSLERELNSQ